MAEITEDCYRCIHDVCPADCKECGFEDQDATAHKASSVIVLDVWGGNESREWLARMLRPLDEALEIARTELMKGFLVNLRDEAAWGTFKEFDNRRMQ